MIRVTLPIVIVVVVVRGRQQCVIVYVQYCLFIYVG